MHCVFVLTSDGHDIYSEMTKMAILSLKITNPGCEVSIFCDKRSFENLANKGNKIFQLANNVIPINTKYDVGVLANREIKTQIGNIVKGSFLFLDSDILVRKPLDSLFDLNCDVALANNHSQDSVEDQIWREDREEFERMNWELPPNYYNGGVIFYKGNGFSEAFSNKWHFNWENNYIRTNRHRDQPSLNFTIHQLKNLNVERLPNQYNHQFVKNNNGIENAAIWHYYADKALNKETKYETILDKAIKGQEPSEESIIKLIKVCTPYKSKALIKIDSIVLKMKNIKVKLVDKCSPFQ